MYLLGTVMLTFKDELRRNVVMRDGGCVVTGVVEDMCINSHVIPRRLFNVLLFLLVTSSHTFLEKFGHHRGSI